MAKRAKKKKKAEKPLKLFRVALYIPRRDSDEVWAGYYYVRKAIAAHDEKDVQTVLRELGWNARVRKMAEISLIAEKAQNISRGLWMTDARMTKKHRANDDD